MSDIVELVAEQRDRAGKGSARASRRAGMVPGVIYGAKKNPSLIAMNDKELIKQLHQTGFFATLFDVKVGSGKERVLARDVQFDPVTDRPIHIDFLRVSATTEVTVQIPMVFLNEEECPGLVAGGILNVVRHADDVAAPGPVELRLRAGRKLRPLHHQISAAAPDLQIQFLGRSFQLIADAAANGVPERDMMNTCRGSLERGLLQQLDHALRCVRRRQIYIPHGPLRHGVAHAAADKAHLRAFVSQRLKNLRDRRGGHPVLRRYLTGRLQNETAPLRND